MLWAHPSTDRYVVIAGAGDPGRLLGLSIGRCLSLTDLQVCMQCLFQADPTPVGGLPCYRCRY